MTVLCLVGAGATSTSSDLDVFVNNLLLEDGDNFLLEDGTFILLE